MSQVVLRPFTAESLSTVAPWFDDAETQRRLGGREWPESLLRLVAEPPSEHRGHLVRERLGWIASRDGSDVALVDTEIYTDGTAAIAFVVDPRRRRQGIGAATLVAIGSHLARAYGVELRVGGIEPENTASVRCARAAGFVAKAAEPDEEGFIYHELRLGSGRASVGR